MTEHQIFIPTPRDRKGRIEWPNIPPKTMIKTLENGRIRWYEKPGRDGHLPGYDQPLE